MGTEVLSPCIKWPGNDVDLSPPTSAQVKNGRSYKTEYTAVSVPGNKSVSIPGCATRGISSLCTVCHILSSPCSCYGTIT